MIRELVNRFNQSLSERLVALRRRHMAPVKIWFEPEINTPHNRATARNLAIAGETVDLSRTGIAFTVSAIRVEEKYLVGQERRLNLEIELPSGTVEMQVIGKRYERTAKHSNVEKYLVGAHILRLDPDSNAAYDHFLRHGVKRKAKAPGSLELGID